MRIVFCYFALSNFHLSFLFKIYLCSFQIPKQLFFHTDYRPLIRDANHHVLDEQTQLAPHLMPPPFIVDSEGNPYPPDIQRLVPGRENCNDSQLIPQIVNINGEDEIIEVSVINDETNRAEPGVLIEQMINRLANEADRRISESRADSDQLDGTQSREVATSSFQPVVRPWTKRNIVKPLDKYTLERSVEIRTAHGEEELMLYNQEPRIHPVAHNTHVTRTEANIRRRRMRIRTSEPEESPVRQRPRSTPGSSSRRNRSERVNVVNDEQQDLERRRRTVTRQIMQDDEDSRDTITRQSNRLANQRRRQAIQSVSSEEETSPDVETPMVNGQSVSDGSRASSESDSAESDPEPNSNESSDYSDWLGEAGNSLQPPKRATIVRKKRKRRVRRITSEEEDENPGVTNEGRHVRRRKRRNIVANINTDDTLVSQSGSAPEEETVVEPSAVTEVEGERRLRRRGPQREIRSQRQAARNAALAVAEVSTEQGEPSTSIAVDEAYLPSDWLSEARPQRSPYHPQIGDIVMYFRQGHEIYAKFVWEKKLYDLAPRSLPWFNTAIREQELVRVLGIKYEIRPPRLCSLKLGIIDVGTDTLTGESFLVKYHDMKHVIDFLVLKQVYDAAVRRDWRPGDHYRCAIEGRWYEGTVIGHQPFEDIYPDSLFLCYKVRWNDGTEDTISPWDIEPVDPRRRSENMSDGMLLLPHEEDVYQSTLDEWSNLNRDSECNRIANLIGQMMTLSAAEPFSAPVDLTAYPDYAEVVPYPVDISLIKRRVENRFYRRKASLQFDVRFIAANAAKYNEPKSRIVKTANIITDLLLEIIRNVNCPDPTIVYHQLVNDCKNITVKITPIQSGPNEGYSRELGEGPSHQLAPPKLKKMVDSKSETNTYNWKAKIQQLLYRLWNHADSDPFKYPVNAQQYPDYHQIIKEPMDLSQVKSKVDNDAYRSPADFNKDIRQVFQNSRLYNQNKKSRIYSMTIRLSAMFENHMKEILQDWRASLLNEERTRSKIRRSGSKSVTPHKTRSTRASREDSEPPTLEPENPAVRREWRRLQTTMTDRPGREREEEGATGFSHTAAGTVESISSPFTFRGRRNANAGDANSRSGYTLRANREQRWRHLLDDGESSTSRSNTPAPTSSMRSTSSNIYNGEPGPSRINNSNCPPSSGKKRLRLEASPEFVETRNKRTRKFPDNMLSADASESELPLSKRSKRSRKDISMPFPSDESEEDSKKSLRTNTRGKKTYVMSDSDDDTNSEIPDMSVNRNGGRPLRSTRSRPASPLNSDDENSCRLRNRNGLLKARKNDVESEESDSCLAPRRVLKYEQDSDFEAHLNSKAKARKSKELNGSMRMKSSRRKEEVPKKEKVEFFGESGLSGNESEESVPVRRSGRRMRRNSRLCNYDSDEYNSRRRSTGLQGSPEEFSAVTVSSRGRVRKATARILGLSD
ncbi:PH-interacting protein-like [Artemia franciscana]|uniref:PH-interacting protein-like n=1 Tax=Artemia franciscana TaxID=6661 RepID=UPI0032DAAC44